MKKTMGYKNSPAEAGRTYLSRRAFFERVCFMTAMLPVTFIWGEHERHGIDKVYIQIITDKLDDVVRVIQISDLHLDKGQLDGSAYSAASIINNSSADLVIMTGDYLNHTKISPVPEKILQDYVMKIKSENGIYAVFGNWDAGLERKLFKHTEVKTLRDQSETVNVKGQKINLVGIDYFNEPRSPETAAKLATGDFNILMTHTPDYIDEVAQGNNIDLFLCGHTHGGQVRVPFLRKLQDGKGEFPYAGAVMLGLVTKNGSKYQSGMYDVRGMKAYVNRGLGVSGIDYLPRIRLFCRPEVVTFDIGPKDKQRVIKDVPWYHS